MGTKSHKIFILEVKGYQGKMEVEKTSVVNALRILLRNQNWLFSAVNQLHVTVSLVKVEQYWGGYCLFCGFSCGEGGDFCVFLGFKERLCVFINVFFCLDCGFCFFVFSGFFNLGWLGRSICWFVYAVLRIAAKTSEKNEKNRSEFELRGLAIKGIQ